MKTAPAHIKRPLRLLSYLSCVLCLLVVPVLLVKVDEPTGPGGPPEAAGATAAGRAAQFTPEQARDAYGRIEMSFEANRGQTDESVNFLARGAGYSLFLKPAEAVLVLARGRGGESAHGPAEQTPGAVETSAKRGGGDAPEAAPAGRQKVLRMKLVGADESAAAVGVDELEGKVNYFTGSDPSKWRADVPTYGRVRYGGIYPGVDVVYYGNQRQLEYDFHVAPGVDARSIKLRFEGADKVEIDAGGDLLLSLGDGVVRQPKPFVYQEVAGARREVAGGYEVGAGGREVGFRVGDYDPSLPLVIDPVIVYSTYLGGDNSDLARAIAVDPSGEAVITGYTLSLNFPTANAFEAAFNGTEGFFGNRDVFVTKINAAGNGFVYSTYLGGTDGEEARGIAVDSSGNAYVAGFTASTNFPIANAIQATKGATNEDAFVTKLNAAGNTLVYSTYLGGSESSEFGEAIAVDSSRNVYVTGSTFSDDFPRANAIQSTFGGGSTDAFVTKINADGDAFVYSTYLGGSGMAGSTQPETGFGIAADSAGNAYITGETSSPTGFPLANAIQGTFGGGISDAFVAKIDPAGDAFVYSTYLGGGDQDAGEGIKADASGNTYVAGFTVSNNFPTANALQPASGGGQDAFVTKLNPTGSTFIYSTYLGGAGGEIAFGIAVDASNNVYLGGSTGSLNTFPVRNANQCTRNGGIDLFITKLNPEATELIYSTYIGGSEDDSGEGIALDPSNNAYMTGSTTSDNFPVVNPIQVMNRGGSPFGDAFVTKFNDALPPNACATPTPTPTGVTAQFSAATYATSENADLVQITVTLSAPAPVGGATVNYATAPDAAVVRCDVVNGAASDRCDYTTRIGTARFAAGEQSKTFDIFVTDDAFVEGAETFNLTLSNPSAGVTLGTPNAAVVTVADNDSNPNAPNPIDSSQFFVEMHYVDFLNRLGEPAGVQAWTTELNNCPPGGPWACDRVETSANFFRSVEFMLKGGFVIRFYKVSLGTIPSYRDFTRDSQRVTGQTSAEVFANREAFANEWVQRPDFKAIYDPLSNQAYVDRLEQTAGVTLQNKAQLVADLNSAAKTRAQVLREIVDSEEVKARMYNRAFVSMQYFGYLRRDPEPGGFDAWLAYLNANPTDYRTMVNGFVNSIEYRLRFGRPN